MWGSDNPQRGRSPEMKLRLMPPGQRGFCLAIVGAACASNHGRLCGIHKQMRWPTYRPMRQAPTFQD